MVLLYTQPTKSDYWEEEHWELEVDSPNDDEVDSWGVEELPPIEGRWLVGIVDVVTINIVLENKVNHTCSMHITFN